VSFDYRTNNNFKADNNFKGNFDDFSFLENYTVSNNVDLGHFRARYLINRLNGILIASLLPGLSTEIIP